MKGFDILKLHIIEEDSNLKNSLIKVSGNALIKELKDILNEIIIKKEGTKTEMYYNFSKTLNCHISTAKRNFLNLNKEKDWVSLFFIQKLLEYWKIHLNKDEKEFTKKRLELQKKYKYLKVGQHKSKQIICIKSLNVLLCKIAGAHAADGHLNRKNGLILEDGDKNAVNIFSEWIRKTFGISGRIFQHPYENGWRYELYNKIIVRYLRVFFGFPIGNKSRTVSFPSIIGDNQGFQRAFLCGAFTFDGSVNINRDVIYTTCSKNFANTIYNIIRKTNHVSLAENNIRWNIKLKPTKKDLWLFEFGTTKYNKLKFFVTKSSRKDLFKTRKVEESMDRLKIFDLNMLSKETSLKQNSLVAYIKILLKERKIKRVYNNKKILPKLIENKRKVPILIKDEWLFKIFTKLMQKTHSHTWKQTADKLNISHPTFIMWKNGKSAIPLSSLLYLSENIDLDINDLLRNSKIIFGKRKFYEYYS